MKKNLFVLFVLCLSILFVCSCQNGTGSDDIAGGALYKVNLSVELPADGPQRTISVSGGSVSGELTYWYRATPQWTAGDAFGKTDDDENDDFVQITSYAANKNIGQFQQGQWKFDVQVKSGANVVYAGTTTEYINAEDTPVTVTVSRGGVGVGTGTITFGPITAVRVNGTFERNKVLMEYGLVGQDRTAYQMVTSTSDNDSQSLSFGFTAIPPLAAGNYWVKLTYLNDTEEDPEEDPVTVGSAIVNFTLDAGLTATISGTLEEGVFQTALITINGISSLSLEEIDISTDSNGVVTFTCEATPADGAAYQWYINGEKAVNGAKVNGATTSECVWSPDAKQNASITCTVTRGNIVASKSITYQVTKIPPVSP